MNYPSTGFTKNMKDVRQGGRHGNQRAWNTGLAETHADPVRNPVRQIQGTGHGSREMSCDECIYYPICFEQRGPCRERKTLEDIKKEIERINENYKRTTADSTTSDKDGKGS